MSAAVQLRFDVAGYALPLRPEALVDLDPFEVAYICQVLKLDDEQTGAIEEAVAAVQAGSYPAGERAAP